MNEESTIRMRHASSSFARAQIASRDLTLARAGTTLILCLDLPLDRDSSVAIVGENGRGKSTLLNALAGSADTGELLGGRVHRQAPSPSAPRISPRTTAARSGHVDGWRPPKGTGKHQRATRASGLVTNVKRRQQLLEAQTVEIPEPPLGLSVPEWRVRLKGALLSAEEVALPGRLETPVSLSLRAGDRLLVRGPNGVGKSTLLAMLAGRLEPGGGRVLRRDGARISLLAQESELASAALADRSAASLYRERAGELVARGALPESRSVPLEQLGLLGSSERARPVGTLSLGQRRRLDLALCLLEQPDVLLLDEPSNHLSIALVDELTEALAALPCAVAVSTHDRGMLNDLAEWPALRLSRVGAASRAAR